MSRGRRVLRYWHTLRHLRPRQIVGRAWFRWYRPVISRLPAPTARIPAGEWVAPAPKPVSMVGPNAFRFLNREGECRMASDWNDEASPKLWLYNLHYFDDLSAERTDARAAWHSELIARWIQENPPADGAGWEPYPTSLRIVNWVKWALAGNSLIPGMADSLALQARWLSGRVEHHLLANHLFVNAKALVFAGLYFEGSEADSWRRQGLGILEREVPAQILNDGGHVERSPMYHALILEDVLDLINVARVTGGVIPSATVAAWQAIAARMAGWLAAMSHPDGRISFFNDAAFGIAPTAGALADYAARMRIAVPTDPVRLSDSGYVSLKHGPAVLIMDLAPVGPDYQPGHAHADTLSYELSIEGQRVLVNSGTSTYAAGTQRQLERSTAAHNTIEIDGTDSSEVWSAFRVARRARVFDAKVSRSEDGFRVLGAHDGYGRLPGRPIHRREWLLGDGRLRITDEISGSFSSAIARHHLHPDVRALSDGTLFLPGGVRCVWSVNGGSVSIREGRWYPEFGKSVANQVIEATLTGSKMIFELTW